jgi:MerR family transcriptional regulator, copper efflux regulator
VKELPIACTLSGADQADRAAAWRAVVSDGAAAMDERGARVRLARHAEPELRELIAAESECCPFLEFDLRHDGAGLRLRVSGPAEARPIIAALVGLG